MMVDNITFSWYNFSANLTFPTTSKITTNRIQAICIYEHD